MANGRIPAPPPGSTPVIPPPPPGSVLVGDNSEEANRKRDYFRGLTQQIQQGALLGFADETNAFIGALMAKATGDEASFGDIRRDIQESERFVEDQFVEENPKTAFAANVVGGLATGGLGATRAVTAATGTKIGGKLLTGATSKGGRVAQGVARQGAVAAPVGAAFGAGAADGDIGDRATGAAVGGLTAAALAPAIRPVFSAVVGTAKAIPKIARKATQFLIRSENDQANLQIGRALQRDGLSDAQVLANKANLGEASTLADAGADATLLELERVASTPGGGRGKIVDTLIDRLQGQRGRVAGLIDKVFSPKHATFAEAREAIQKEAAERAAPLYEKAYLTPIDNSNPALQSLLKNPRIQRAIPKAVERLKSKSVDPEDPNSELIGQIIDELDPKNPSLLLWDHVKRILDDERTSAFISGNRSLSRDITGNLKQMRSVLDKQSPDYAEARKVWGGGQEQENAFRLGTHALDKLTDLEKGADETIRLFDEMSEAGKEVYRNGLGLKLRNIVDTAPDTQEGVPGASLLTRIYGSPQKKRIINHAIPDRGARKEVLSTLAAERKFASNTNQVIRGSQTALREALKKESKASAGKLMGDAIRGKFAVEGNMFAMLGLGREIAQGIRTAEGVNRKVAQKLLETEGANIQKTLQAIDKLIGVPDSLKQALGKGPVDTVRFFLDNKTATARFNHLATAVIAGIAAEGGRNEEGVLQIPIQDGVTQ